MKVSFQNCYKIKLTDLENINADKFNKEVDRIVRREVIKKEKSRAKPANAPLKTAVNYPQSDKTNMDIAIAAFGTILGQAANIFAPDVSYVITKTKDGVAIVSGEDLFNTSGGLESRYYVLKTQIEEQKKKNNIEFTPEEIEKELKSKKNQNIINKMFDEMVNKAPEITISMNKPLGEQIKITPVENERYPDFILEKIG